MDEMKINRGSIEVYVLPSSNLAILEKLPCGASAVVEVRPDEIDTLISYLVEISRHINEG